MRKLSDGFMRDLQNGMLTPVLEHLRADFTLAFCIRNDYVNIYYRGGSLLRLIRKNGRYRGEFEPKYLGGCPAHLKGAIEHRELIPFGSEEDVGAWLRALPLYKQAMDIHIGPRKERELQQEIFTANNRCLANKKSPVTDYLLFDMEYQEKGDRSSGRADLIGFHWPSTPASHTAGLKQCRLVFGELKYGDQSLKGSSGVIQHVKKISKFCANTGSLRAFKQEAVTVCNQLQVLDLMNTCAKPLLSFSDELPIFLLLLAEHKPRKRALARALCELNTDRSWQDSVMIKVGVSCFMGHGLFDDSVYCLEHFLDKFARQLA